VSVTELITQLITLIELDSSPQLRHIVVPRDDCRNFDSVKVTTDIRTSREDLVYSLFVHFSSSLLLLLVMEFIESSKGGKKLMLNGYMHTNKAVKKNRIRW